MARAMAFCPDPSRAVSPQDTRAETRKPTRYPPVGPKRVPAPAAKPANTGSPTSPSRR